MTELVFTRKSFSLHGQSFVHEAGGRLVYEASRDRLFGRRISVRDATGDTLVTLEPQPWKPDPTWLVEGQLGSFQIKRHKKAFERSYWIEQGSFDGLVIEGGFKDRAFRLRRGEQILAEADEKQFSGTTEHTLTLHEDTDQTRLLTGIVGLIIMKEKQEARREQ